LLSVLLPFVQGDVGGQLFSMRKWSKRMFFLDSASDAAEHDREERMAAAEQVGVPSHASRRR